MNNGPSGHSGPFTKQDWPLAKLSWKSGSARIILPLNSEQAIKRIKSSKMKVNKDAIIDVAMISIIAVAIIILAIII